MVEQSLNKQSLKALNQVFKLFKSAPRWIQGNYHETRTIKGKDFDCYCLVGAFNKVDGENERYTLLSLAAEDPFVSRFAKKHNIPNYDLEGRVINYNDSRGRTYTQILRLLSRMKSRLEKVVDAEKAK